MNNNDNLKNQNRWARCWYRIEVNSEGNGDGSVPVLKIKISYLEFDYNVRKDVVAGYVKLERVPSHFNTRTRKAIGRAYRMSDNMFDSADLVRVCEDMNLETEVWQEAVMGKNLKRSDLYYIEELFVEPKFRGQGLGSHILRALPKEIRINLHEQRPVIAVIPYPIEYSPSDPACKDAYLRLVSFYKRNGYAFPKENTQTMIYNLE